MEASPAPSSRFSFPFRRPLFRRPRSEHRQQKSAIRFLFWVFILIGFCFFHLVSLRFVWFCVGILVKGMYELWGEGSDYDELEESIRNYPEERKSPFLQSGSSFKISVESFGKAISFEEQNERIRGLAYIPFKVQQPFGNLVFCPLFSSIFCFCGNGEGLLNTIFYFKLLLLCD